MWYDQYETPPRSWVYQPCWVYEFPNGHGVYVHPDSRFRFVVKHRTKPGDPYGSGVVGLTTVEVEATLKSLFETSPPKPTGLTGADRLYLAALGPAGEHLYLSTACLHGAHEHCRSTVDGGVKVPATCKFCDAVCMCTECDHGMTGAAT